MSEKNIHDDIDNCYVKKELTISVKKANIYSFVFSLPLILVFWSFFALNVNFKRIDWLEYITFPKVGMLFIAMILSVPLHEMLHGLGWVAFCEKKFRSIKFGFIKELLTPYCHCKEILSVSEYYVGLLLPLVVLGIIPFIVSILFDSAFFMIISFLNIFLAGGDLIVAFMLLKYYNKNNKVIDHPKECGCILYLPKKQEV